MPARIWRRLFDRVTRFGRRNTEARIKPPGSLRPIELGGVTQNPSRRDRHYDEEIEDRFVRSPEYGAACTGMVRNCPEAASAIATIVQASLFGVNGDAVGFYAESPDRAVNDIIERVVREVLGGMRLERALYELLEGGNSFATPLLEYAPSSTGYRLSGLAYRPPWEMFRMEDNNGFLLGFEQRRYRSANDTEYYHPLACCHWRYRTQKLYGRSLFHESLDDWDDLQQIQSELVRAAQSIGINPTVHEMPAGRGSVYRQDYADRFFEEQAANGAVGHIFVDHGVKVGKAGSGDPDLKALQSTFEMLQRRIILNSHVPAYMFGLESAKANNLSGAPNEQFVRFIRHIQTCLSQGIRFLIDLELALHGVDRDRWVYDIVFPSLGGDNPDKDVL